MAAEFTSFPANWRGVPMHDDLWRYACALYERPGMESACLTAQAAGSNVCLALCALWLEERGVVWSGARAATLQGIALPWTQAVVEPLRTLRQQWREAADADAALRPLREQVKRLEVEAEQALLERLQRATQAWPTGSPADPRWLDAAVPGAGIRAALRQAVEAA